MPSNLLEYRSYNWPDYKKSVKSRVDGMLSSGVIDKFITFQNPSIFGSPGYNMSRLEGAN